MKKRRKIENIRKFKTARHVNNKFQKERINRREKIIKVVIQEKFP